MNWKPTWVLLAVAAMLLAFIVLVEHPLRVRKERLANRLILPGFNPAAVTNVLVQPWDQPAIQAVRDGSGSNGWRLTRPISYPAHSEYVAGLLDILAQLEWLDCVTEAELTNRPNAQEEFGFAKPRFTLLLQGSAPDSRLEVGQLGPYGDRVYLQVVGNPLIYLADSRLLNWIPPNNYGWRDPALLDLAHVSFQSLQVRAAGKELIELTREPASHLWFMTKPLSARANAAKIDVLLGQLQTMSVNNFITDDPQPDLETYALQDSATTPELALSFLRGTNTVAGLRVGGSLTNTNLAFARRDHPGNIVTVAKEPLRPWLAPYTNFLDQHFISLPPSLIESISVRGDDTFTVQKQTNGQWQVVADKTFPADALFMTDWLAGFTNVPAEIFKTVVTDFSPYGLVHPALQYTLRFPPDAGARADAQLDFGVNTNGQVFERRLGEDFVNSVSPGDYYRLPRASWQLRDRSVWSFDPTNVLSVTVHQRGGLLKYLCDPDGNWTYAPNSISQVSINSASLKECIFRLGQLRAIYWDGVGESGLERFGFQKEDHAVDLEIKRGGKIETLRIQFGARSPYLHPYASVVRDGQRLIFEFPADLYENLVRPNLTVLTARINSR